MANMAFDFVESIFRFFFSFNFFFFIFYGRHEKKLYNACIVCKSFIWKFITSLLFTKNVSLTVFYQRFVNNPLKELWSIYFYTTYLGVINYFYYHYVLSRRRCGQEQLCLMHLSRIWSHDVNNILERFRAEFLSVPNKKKKAYILFCSFRWTFKWIWQKCARIDFRSRDVEHLR